MKRFYETVAVAGPPGGPWRIALDGREVRTPGRLSLDIPTAGLADAVAAEWRAQGEKIDPATMPLTALSSTVIDRVRPQRVGVAAQLLRFAETDMVCYRAERPRDLVIHQGAVWQPLVEWTEQRFDARLIVVTGILPVPQPEATIRAFRAVLSAMDDHALTAVGSAASASGSLVIALALVEGRIDAAAAATAAHLDEMWQARQWGEEMEATERRAAASADLAAAARFHALTRGRDRAPPAPR